MTDTQLIHKASGIRRIRECCRRAKIELESNLVTVTQELPYIVPGYTFGEYGTMIPPDWMLLKTR